MQKEMKMGREFRKDWKENSEVIFVPVSPSKVCLFVQVHPSPQAPLTDLRSLITPARLMWALLFVFCHALGMHIIKTV